MSLIARQLDTLRACGVDDIVIATGYRAEMLRLDGTRQVRNADWETTNMVETLFAAQTEFSEDIIVAYADIVYEPKVLQALLSSSADISVVIDTGWRDYWNFRFEDPLSDAESLRLDDAGLIVDIGNKVEHIDDIEAQYIGLMRFRGDGIEALHQARRSMFDNDRPWKRKRPVEKAYMTDLLTEMVLNGEHIVPVPIRNGWLEIDTVEDYENAAQGFRDGTISRFFAPQVEK